MLTRPTRALHRFSRSGVLMAALLMGVGAPQAAEQSAEEVAKQLANPNTSLAFLAFQTDYVAYTGDLPDAGRQDAYKLSFQPSIPYPIGDGMNFFLRPLIPVFFDQPVPVVSGATVAGDLDVFTTQSQNFKDTGIELGDIGFDAAIGKTFDNGMVMIGGIVGTLPTATDDNVGLDQWLLGPEFLLGKGGGWGFVGMLLSHQWDVAGEDDYDTSVTGGQYFYTINLKDAWQIQAQPTFSYNHEAESGDKWTFPVGVGVSKTAKVGKLPVKFSVQYWHYVEQPDPFGPDYQIRFQFAPVVPLPW